MTPTARDALAVALVALAIVLSVVREVWGHGPEWDWIAREPRYVDRVGIHCCSTDCYPVSASEVTESNDGLSYGGEMLRHGERGLYWSAEPNAPDGQRHWVCKRNGRLKCIWRPQPQG